jgi:hypothetical protein
MLRHKEPSLGPRCPQTKDLEIHIHGVEALELWCEDALAAAEVVSLDVVSLCRITRMSSLL